MPMTLEPIKRLRLNSLRCWISSISSDMAQKAYGTSVVSVARRMMKVKIWTRLLEPE